MAILNNSRHKLSYKEPLNLKSSPQATLKVKSLVANTETKTRRMKAITLPTCSQSLSSPAELAPKTN